MQRITYTQGNTVSVSVPLAKKTIEKTGNVTSITTEDYTPGDGDTIEIKLIGERRTYCYTPTMSESVAVFDLQGNEVAGRYGIEVNIYKTNGEKMRYAEPYALELVPFTGIVDNFVVGAVELDASVFFAMRGEKGDKGDPGEDGVGISSITKVSTQGLVDTYAITYTDGTSTTFQVTNGAKGEQGAQGIPGVAGADGRGIISITKTASHGLIDTYTITYTDRTTSTYQVTNGAKGDTGNGIASIVKTGTSGLVDTYTITYSDATTSTFNVTNGAPGTQGEDGVGITSIEKTATAGKVDTYTITMTDGSTFTFEVINGMDGVDLGLANIVNDLTTGGATNVLSAEMGKVLAEMIGGDVTPTYEVEGNLMPFDDIVMGKKVTAITKASDNTITPTTTDDDDWAYVIVTLDKTQHTNYGMCGYNLAGESEGFGFFGIVYNSNNGSYYTGNINASIARNANIAAYENAKIDAIKPNQAAFNIHQIAINIPCSSDAMQEAMANKTLGLFTGSIVPKTTCSTMKESHNIFDSTIRAFSTVNYLNSNYISVEPSTKYVLVGASLLVKTYNGSFASTGTICADQQPDYSELKNVYGAPYCTFTTGANDAYIMLNNQIGGTSGVTDEQWAKWQKLTIYKASLGYLPIAPHFVSKDYEPTTPKMYDLAFIGDSITFLGWYKQMFTKIAIKSHYANGTNSIAWTSSTMESKFQALIDAYSNGDVVDDFGETITAPQYIFVFLGTNADAVAGDMATTMGISVGSLSPTADRTQAMRKFIYMLRNAFPNSKIIGLAPYNNFNQSTIAKMVEVANAVESNYQYLGVKCWNLSKISGIMPDFDTSSVHTYLSDGTHPNAAGIELLSDIGAKIVEEKQ